MARRRLSLGAYMRRRWRALGAIAVLLLGSLLVVAVTDRGHDPVWQARADAVDAPSLAPDGSAAYALLRAGGNVTGVAAYDGEDGTLRWSGRLNATRALIAAAPDGVLVANDFPDAFLTAYSADGRVLWQVNLEGNPVSLAVDGRRSALALNGAANPVLLFDSSVLAQTFRHPSPLRAMDMHAGLVATGGLHGEVHVWRADGSSLANLTLPMSIRSLRLSADGSSLLVGGATLDALEPRGVATLLDLTGAVGVRWQHETAVPVGIVEIDDTGLLALAVEDAPPTTTVPAYDASTGATRWTRFIEGSVARDDAGASGGVALSPRGDVVMVSTLRGDVLALDTRDGTTAWSYRAAGSTGIAFADGAPERAIVAARLIENRPYSDTLLVFDAGEEPILQRAGVVAIALSGLAALAFAALLSVGYLRARRSY